MKCKAKTKTGKPCKGNALRGGKFCFTHAPETRQAQAAARKLGGYNSSTSHAGDPEAVNKSPRTIEESYSILDYALAETLVMDNCYQRNNLLVKIATAYMDAKKIGELGKELSKFLPPQIIEIIKVKSNE